MRKINSPNFPLRFSVGQFFGNLPASGVLDRDFRNISFKWSSLRTIYALVYLALGAFEVCLMVFKGFTRGFNIVTAGEPLTMAIHCYNKEIFLAQSL